MNNGTVSDIRRRASAVCGLVGMAASLTVIFSWLLSFDPPKSLLPGLPKMALITAICFFIAGGSVVSGAEYLPLALQSTFGRDGSDRRRRLVRIGGISLIAVGLLKLGELAFGLYPVWTRIGLEEANNTASPGRMALATATDFVLLGSSLLLSRTRFVRLFQAVLLTTGLVAWLGLSHYLYGGRALVPFAEVSLPTALLFLLMSFGALCMRSDAGLTALLISDSSGGLLARRLAPAALIVPLVLGWLCLLGERQGWYGGEAAIALLALTNIVVFGGLILMNAARLHVADVGRRKTKRRLVSQLERLNQLQQITQAIGQRMEISAVFQAVTRSLEIHLRLDFCCVLLFTEGQEALTMSTTGPRSAQRADRLTIAEPVNVHENGLTPALNGHLVYQPDISSLPYPLFQSMAKAQLRAVVASPLQFENRTFGILLVARLQADSFDSNDCEFLKQLSEHAALATHQAELHGALQRAYDDLRQTQQAAMQQERLRALGQMASGIAHDINNAISPVALYTEILLEQETQLSARARNYLEITQRAIEDVAATVGRMREFYRQRKPDLEPFSVDLNQLAIQTAELTRARWSDMPQQRGVVIDLQTQLDPGLPAVVGVESEIREAMTNLIFNAVDAMPEGGTLTLRTSRHDGTPDRGMRQEVTFEVIDSGVGMDEATRLRCLEPFFTTKGDRGTGLGLAMVYGIAERHNAELEIDSSPDNGTTVRLRFALASVETPAAGPSIQVPRGLSILAIDDEPNLLQALRELLMGDGHTVVTAEGGRQGIEQFRNSPSSFSVVITDLGMPHLDGHMVAQEIRRLRPDMPVILLTGWGHRLSAEADSSPNVDLVLGKPPKVGELRAALAQLCGLGSGVEEHRTKMDHPDGVSF